MWWLIDSVNWTCWALSRQLTHIPRSSQIIAESGIYLLDNKLFWIRLLSDLLQRINLTTPSTAYRYSWWWSWHISMFQLHIHILLLPPPNGFMTIRNICRCLPFTEFVQLARPPRKIPLMGGSVRPDSPTHVNGNALFPQNSPVPT